MISNEAILAILQEWCDMRNRSKLLKLENRTFGYLLLVRTDQSDSPFENVARQYWELKEVLGNDGRLIICMFHLQVQPISELCNSVSLVYKKHLAVILKKKKETQISASWKKEKSLGDKQHQINHKTILRKITTWSNWGGISPPQILENLETCTGFGSNLSTLWAYIKKIKLMLFSNVTVKWILHGELLRDTPKFFNFFRICGTAFNISLKIFPA